jgi:hypothetical protein
VRSSDRGCPAAGYTNERAPLQLWSPTRCTINSEAGREFRNFACGASLCSTFHEPMMTSSQGRFDNEPSLAHGAVRDPGVTRRGSAEAGRADRPFVKKTEGLGFGSGLGWVWIGIGVPPPSASALVGGPISSRDGFGKASRPVAASSSVRKKKQTCCSAGLFR